MFLFKIIFKKNIRTVLGLDSGSIMLKSELKHVQWVDIQGTVKTYRYALILNSYLTCYINYF